MVLSLSTDVTNYVASKLYHFHAASGIPAPPVFVIADSSMSDETLDENEVMGLTNSVACSIKGYLYFTKTRCGNKKIYDWYGRTVVCPFVNELRDSYKCQV